MKTVFPFFIIILLLCLPFQIVNAAVGKQKQSEETDNIQTQLDQMLDLEKEYASIQEVLDSISGSSSFSFQSYVKALLRGDISFSFREMGQHFLDGIRAEVSKGRNNLSFLLATGIASGMLAALSKVFINRQAADMGFYILYLLLFSVLSVTFIDLASLAEHVFHILLQFMKVLLPAYYLAIAFCTGAKTSYIFYETMLIMITVVELFILHIILPAIRIYFLFGMVHHITEKPFLTRLLDLLERLIKQSIKVIFIVLLSIQGIEGMLAPFADAAARSVVLKAVNVIPGLGTGVAGIAEAILKSGMLLKNAIGLAGIFGIIFLCAYPIGKMIFYTFLYHFTSAVTETIAEARLLSCMTCCAHTAGLLLYTACYGILLFLLTIGITLATTSI